jgi:hypothetical protein
MDKRKELKDLVEGLGEDDVADVLAYVRTLREPRVHTGEDLAETLTEEKIALAEREEQERASRYGG